MNITPERDFENTLQGPSENPEKQSGRDRLFNSVIWSWGGHFVFIIAGFLLPRFIDRNVGQDALGVWDFSWSLVGYSGLVLLGVGSSVNRYVAMHLADNDIEGLNQSVSSVFCIQMIMGLIVLVLTLTAVWLIPILWNVRIGTLVSDAQWLVLFLGMSTSLSFAFGAFDGVLTGCHRWDVYNGINAGCHAITVVAMLTALVFGFGIVSLGILYFVETALAVLIRLIMVYQVCPSLKVRFSYARWPIALSMLGFGAKTYMNDVARLLLYQTNSILIVTFLGPAMIALYSRPMALIQHVRTFSAKLAHTMTPVVSELEAVGDRNELATLALQMSRYNVAIALPPILFLCILGGPLLLLWMGKGYRQDLLVAILAAGHLFTIANQPLQTTMIGMNAHGRPAIAMLCAAITSVILCYVGIGYLKGGLIAAALSVCIPLILADGLYVSFYSCRKLNVSFVRYLMKVWMEPALFALPFALCLIMVRISFPPIQALIWGILAGGAIILVVYWRWVIPTSLRNKIMNSWHNLSMVHQKNPSANKLT